MQLMPKAPKVQCNEETAGGGMLMSSRKEFIDDNSPNVPQCFKNYISNYA